MLVYQRVSIVTPRFIHLFPFQIPGHSVPFQESTGISEPMPVAATFVTEVEGKAMLGQVARLDTLVTVVDGKNFFETYGTTERPKLSAQYPVLERLKPNHFGGCV